MIAGTISVCETDWGYVFTDSRPTSFDGGTGQISVGVVWMPTENHRVCSLHFNEDDFKTGQKRILKNNAISSKLDPNRVQGEGHGTASSSTQTEYVPYIII